MTQFDFDLLVIGGGSGGVRAARVSGSLGAKVGIVESHRFGGTCVNVGCVPKKLYGYAAQAGYDLAELESLGWRIDAARFDWATLQANKNKNIEFLNGAYERMLTHADVTVLRGRGVVVDPHTVAVDGKHHTARFILLATGGTPALPTIPGAEYLKNSNDIFAMASLPRRLLVAGGGYIALEFASIFAGLGSQVSLVHRREQVLRGFDSELSAALLEALAARGIDLQLPKTIERVEKRGDGLRAHLSDGSSCDADLILSALGRVPATRGLGLEAAGVALNDDGTVQVELGRYQTSVPSIYAVGDLIPGPNLTPVAIREGMVVAHALFSDEPWPISYDHVTTAVFTAPPLAAVGLTEEVARERFAQVDIYTTRFRSMKHSLSQSGAKTLMKLVVDGQTQRVLGAHMFGEDAPEIIQSLAVALVCGATKQQFDATIALHPTAAEEFVTMRSKVR